MRAEQNGTSPAPQRLILGCWILLSAGVRRRNDFCRPFARVLGRQHRQYSDAPPTLLLYLSRPGEEQRQSRHAVNQQRVVLAPRPPVLSESGFLRAPKTSGPPIEHCRHATPERP